MRIKKIFVALSFAICSALFILSTANAASNTLTIKEVSGLNQSGRVVTFGRPFKQDEFLQGSFPQAVLNGTPVLTQVDVKNRWPNGSLKFAIISFVVPALEPNQTVSVSFQNSSTSNNDNYLDVAGMMAPAFDFDAEIKISLGATQSASARTMLQNNHFTYWLRGPIVTAVILADHSVARSYDMGFDSHRSFRPIFHAYFHPSSGEVKLHYIGETASTEVAQDVSFNLELTRGVSHENVYSKANVVHHAFSRWIKKFSIHPQAGEVEIDMNTGYLIETYFLANYNQSHNPSAATVAATVNAWNNEPKDLFDKGFWNKLMGTSGSRGDIGPETDWATLYLFKWDHNLLKAVLGNADLAAAWPMHFREGRLGKRFDRAQTVDAVGHVISLNARPTLYLYSANQYIDHPYTQGADRINIVGPITEGGWFLDAAHQPNPYFIPYIVTGEYWYLEQLLMWAGRGAFFANPAYDRNNQYGVINDIQQVRGHAWLFRNRTLAAFIADDSSPEKSYFDQLMIDAIAAYEARVGITNTPRSGAAIYQWIAAGASGYWWGSNPPQNFRPPLHFWGPNNGVSGAAANINTAETGAIAAPWEYSMLTGALGRAREMGYPTDLLIAYIGEFFIGGLLDPAFNPYLMADYQLPYRKLNGTFFSSWAETRTGFHSTYNPTSWSDLGHAQHGYSHMLRSAVSFVAHQAGGANAWALMAPMISAPALNENPKWAFDPRTPPNTAGFNLAPQVNAGPTQTINPPVNPVNLNGTVSDDGLPNPPGTVISQWTKLSGPGSVTFGDASQVDTTATFSSVGVYQLRLTGSDGALSAYHTVNIYWGVQPPSNTAPVVDAGPDQNVFPAINPVNLNGTVNDDGLPSPPGQFVAYWEKVDGPGTVTFGNPNSVDTTASFSEGGTYRLRLSATDGALSASDIVSITMGAFGSNSETSETKLITCFDPKNAAHRTQPPVCFNLSNHAAQNSISVNVYDNKGKLITELVKGNYPAGLSTVVWNGKNMNGEESSSGTYIVVLKTVDGVSKKKLVRIR